MLSLRSHAIPAIGGLVLLSACSDLAQIPTAPIGPEPQLAVSAYASQIVINEVMADPNAVLDASG
ncbi:MAG TPA: hypothetical protein VLK84_29580, partial [Longimicrobium sp.]|nr:hypothetical protein [Longimicrobium sp.]